MHIYAHRREVLVIREFSYVSRDYFRAPYGWGAFTHTSTFKYILLCWLLKTRLRLCLLGVGNVEQNIVRIVWFGEEHGWVMRKLRMHVFVWGE